MKCEPTIPIQWSPTEKQSGVYRRLFLSRKPPVSAKTLFPNIVCEASNVSPNRQHVASYRRVCGLPDQTNVPLFYPHALLGTAHLLMIGHKQFPVGSMGLLHVRNHCVRYRPFGIDQPWHMRCEVSRQRNVDKGLEFDFDSTVSIAGDVVWRSISTYLKRGEALLPPEESRLAGLFPKLDASAMDEFRFQVPSDIGKQYAKVTGDYNPIHVSFIAAKLFGFPRAIAHGMWSVARTLPELPELAIGPVRHDVAFKGPMLVGSEAHVKLADESVNNGRFDLYCGANPRPVMVGVYRSTEASDCLQA